MLQTSLFDLLQWDDENDYRPITHDTEPTVLITGGSMPVILTIKSSGIFYNQDAFPHDTAGQAAQRIYDSIKTKCPDLGIELDLNLTLQSYKEYPQRKFRVNKDGVDHNYDVDTWHWWMLEYLDRLVKSMPS